MMKAMNTVGQLGFTLIELMIVIAIVGILSAVALPAYQGYTERARLSGALQGAATYRTAVGLCASQKALADCDAGSNGIVAAIADASAGAIIKYVDALSVADGVITIEAHPSGKTIVLTPTVNTGQSLEWGIAGTAVCGETGADEDACLDIGANS